jgi:hypothetical protein
VAHVVVLLEKLTRPKIPRAQPKRKTKKS